MRERILDVSRMLLETPTAPWREGQVREKILDFCRGLGLKVRIDKIGNVIAEYGAGYKGQVVAFCAHTDHPGFIIEKAGLKKTSALFYGGVERKYFAGAKVIVHTAAGEKKTLVKAAALAKKERAIRAQLGPVECEIGDMAVWDLPAFEAKGDLLFARACDDLVGCAAILASLEALVRKRFKARVIGVFTVAEESGLNGAKYICKSNAIPKNATVLSIETSAHRLDAHIGQGVVIRVGDRREIFAPEVTSGLVEIAAVMAKRDSDYKYQRKLMDAGTCEATVYQQAGYKTGAICICLGNYHNRSDKGVKIAPEFVSIADLENMVKFFVEIARNRFKARPYKKAVYRVEKGRLGQVRLVQK